MKKVTAADKVKTIGKPFDKNAEEKKITFL